MATNEPTDPAALPQQVFCYAIDDVALASLRNQPDDLPRCALCDRDIDGEPGGSGLFMWTRGEEVRFDEPPLCAQCATAVGVTAFSLWACNDEGE
ncbi:MAG: hypothetical protein JRI68_32070 [Deltaproteobacteria bacterium]|nr:hypothetical protein [Deltaproteobacteria bacterium]